jgi:hypothetical protein
MTNLDTKWTCGRDFSQMAAIIEEAQGRFARILERYIASDSDKRIAYQRFLSFEYHMTRGVNRYFMRVAASPKLSRLRPLRKFFTDFANEEELHYLVAASDLKALGEPILPMPFDVALWHSYFERVTDSNPFIRAGAAVILENISDGVARPLVKEALSAPFLDRSNTKFLVLHQHETLPHGDQIIEALTSAALQPEDVDDLILGARQGMVLYLRLVEWALLFDAPETVAAQVTAHAEEVNHAEIAAFKMDDLVHDY